MTRCPICLTSMSRNLCPKCNRIFSDEKLMAILNSVRMSAVAMTSELVTITMGDGRDIRMIFDERDRKFDKDRMIWIITNASRYSYVPCIKTAMSALAKQFSLFETFA